MSTLLKVSQMLLGGGALLLFAGAFPRWGVPSVYEGGAMLLLGFLGTLFTFWAAIRLAGNQKRQLLIGLVFSALCATSAFACVEASKGSWRFATEGGVGWFPAVTLGCTALMAFLFVGIFAYLSWRIMTKRLWLALAHLSLVPLALGAYLDYCFELNGPLIVLADNPTPTETLLLKSGKEIPLGFALKLSFFEHTNSEEQGISYKAHYEIKEGENLTHGTLRVNYPIEYKGWQFSLMNYQRMERTGASLLLLEARHAPGRLWARIGMVALLISLAAWCWWPQRQEQTKV